MQVPSTVLRYSALLALAAAATARATPLNVINQCSETVQFYDNSAVEALAPGGTTSRNLAQGFNGMFRNGVNAQATLAEFSITGGFAWYDISIIPTGPKSGPEYCPDLASCKALTGGTGYNTPMQIAPSGCQTVTCMEDGCADAYQFPKDDGKTHACADTTTITLTFCPGGSGGSTQAPATQAPTTQPPTQAPTTQAPTPAPTPSPTPSPTPEPTTQAPTPEPTTEAPTPEPTPEPTTEAPTPEPTPSSEAASASASADGSVADSEAGSTKSSASRSAGDDVAGEADNKVQTLRTATPSSADKQSTVASAPSTVSAPTATNDESGSAEKISVQSEDSGSAATTVVAGVLGSAAVIAAVAAIVVVRKKKQELEAGEPKMSIYGGGADGIVTPVDNIHVL